MAQDDLKLKLGADPSGLRTGLNAAIRESEKAGKRMGDALQKSKVEEVLKRQAEQADKTAMAFNRLGIAVVAIAGASLKVAADFEMLQAQLVTVTGSSDEAAKAFAQLQKFASETPFSLQELVDAFIRLKGRGLDPSRDALIAYGNIAASMGKSLNQAIEAVADAATGEFERLKEFGIRASKQGDQISFTFQGITTSVANSSAEIEKYLQSIGAVNFAGAMERQSQTLKGAVSNIQDALQIAANAFAGQSGLSGIVAMALREVSGSISANESETAAFGAAVAEIVATMADAVKISLAGISGAFEIAGQFIGASAAYLVTLFSGEFDKLGKISIDFKNQTLGIFDELARDTNPTAYRDKLREIQDEMLRLKAAAGEAPMVTPAPQIGGGLPETPEGVNAAAKAKEETDAILKELERRRAAETRAFQDRQMMQAEDFEAQQERLARLQAMMGDAQTQALLQEQIRYDEQMELLYGFHEMELEALGGFHKAKEDLEKEHAKRLAEIHMQGLDEQFSFTQYAKTREQTYLATLADNALSKLSTQSRKAFEINKALSLANAVVKTAEAVQSAYAFGAAFGGPPAGAAAAALAAAAGLANINAIKSAKFGGGQGAAIPGAQAPGGGVVGADGQVQGGAAQGGGPQQVTISIPQDAILSGRALAELISQATSNGAVIVGVNG